MTYKEMRDRVAFETTRTDRLLQLAEECNELSQAILKLERARRGSNPTPRSYDECYNNLLEELVDVEVCMDACLIRNENFQARKTEKMARWLHRLGNE